MNKSILILAILLMQSQAFAGDFMACQILISESVFNIETSQWTLKEIYNDNIVVQTYSEMDPNPTLIEINDNQTIQIKGSQHYSDNAQGLYSLEAIFTDQSKDLSFKLESNSHQNSNQYDLNGIFQFENFKYHLSISCKD